MKHIVFIFSLSVMLLSGCASVQNRVLESDNSGIVLVTREPQHVSDLAEARRLAIQKLQATHASQRNQTVECHSQQLGEEIQTECSYN